MDLFANWDSLSRLNVHFIIECPWSGFDQTWLVRHICKDYKLIPTSNWTSLLTLKEFDKKYVYSVKGEDGSGYIGKKNRSNGTK